jgi:hypothetical protein
MNLPAQPALPPPPQQAAPTQPLEVQSRWEALREVGYWKNIDFIVLTLIVLTWIVGICWKIFGTPTATHLVALLLFNVLTVQMWGVSLIYRTMDFVLQTRANIQLLPFESARIAMGYMQGGQPSK